MCAYMALDQCGSGDENGNDIVPRAHPFAFQGGVLTITPYRLPDAIIYPLPHVNVTPCLKSVQTTTIPLTKQQQ